MEKTLTLKQTIGNNIAFLLENRGISRKKMCEDLDIKYTTLCDWVNGKTYPRIDSLEVVAEYFSLDIQMFFTDMQREQMEKRVSSYARRLKLGDEYSDLFPDGFWTTYGSEPDWEAVAMNKPLDEKVNGVYAVRKGKLVAKLKNKNQDKLDSMRSLYGIIKSDDSWESIKEERLNKI